MEIMFVQKMNRCGANSNISFLHSSASLKIQENQNKSTSTRLHREVSRGENENAKKRMIYYFLHLLNQASTYTFATSGPLN